MIPKVIHYCWFGRGPLPESAEKCIASWKKTFPGFQIKEWNEENFDVNVIPYTQEAYQAKKYAFVSDYARFWILYKFGGVYFDVDVEAVKPIDDLLEKGPVWAFETKNQGESRASLAGGLCLAMEEGNPFCKKILDKYQQMSFYDKDGNVSSYTMNPMMTDLFYRAGLKGDGSVECLLGNYFYPQDYFNPLDDATGRLRITENTRSIHWFMKSWLPSQAKWKIWAKRMARRIFGTKTLSRIRQTIK